MRIPIPTKINPTTITKEPIGENIGIPRRIIPRTTRINPGKIKCKTIPFLSCFNEYGSPFLQGSVASAIEMHILSR
jgi:hypothetical protein